jgi:glycosyltransferase involved in cell wall biosynthesis
MIRTDAAARTVSIVIPAYNEERFIGTLLQQIAAIDLSPAGFTSELIVVDDGSRDRTADIAATFPGVRVLRKANGGKGSAVLAGVHAATGDWLLIQDADLEYDPRDYLPMLQSVAGGHADVVYGSRYLKHPGGGIVRNLLSGRHPQQSLSAYAGGQSLSFVGLVFTGRYLTDTVTALKLFPRALLLELNLRSPGFELDHEITAKVLARGIPILEVPIRYYPRSRAEGKKIGLRDWFRAVRTFARYRRQFTR